MDTKLPCPVCGKVFHPKSLGKHKTRKHGALVSPPAPSTKQSVTTLFIAIPAQGDIKSDDANTIRALFHANNPNDDPNIQMLCNAARLNELQGSLGRSLVANCRGVWYIHQLLATVTLAINKFVPDCQLLQHKWESAISLIRSGTLLDSLKEQNGQVVIFISSTLADWPDMSQSEFLDTIYRIVVGHTHIRVYPSISEQRFEMLKIGDIRALDEIATAFDCPVEFSMRPTTCGGYGECKLSNLRPRDYHVLKRSESCASAHVYKKKSEDRDKLRCALPGTPLNDKTTRPMSSSPFWFHQEFVPELDAFEFRVFIKNNGAAGEVIHTIWTSSVPLAEAVKGKRSKIKTRKVSEDDFHWAVPDGASRKPDIQRAKLKELKEFALYVYQALRRREDSNPHFETLEVGVRLDIGVLSRTANDARGATDVYIEPGKYFFVNEITRWPEADWFSESTLETPYLRLCAEFAEPLARYLG